MEYQNPIIAGFNPDPSICRVDDDYYLVTSSFEYFPGIPIYHSVDLVNWVQIGNAVEGHGQFPFYKAKSSGGIWAPTIRYSDGRFYITATFSDVGNFIISSDRPDSGWSAPVWVEMDGIDPSMFFENGKMYYCANDCGSRNGNGEGISMAEVDRETGLIISEIKRIWTGTGGGFLEAPHIYRIGEWYYLLAAEGGTRFNHMVTEARSRCIWGPYESCPDNPILTNRNDTSKQIMCCGHADLAEDKNSNLWLVHLGTRPSVGDMSHLGRETFLTPAYISDNWIKTSDGMAKLSVGTPAKANRKIQFHCDFTSLAWEKQWIFLRQPNIENYQRCDRTLILKPTSVKISDSSQSPTFAAIRQPDFECTARVSFDFKPEKVGDEAGVAIYIEPNFIYRIFKRRKDDGDYIEVVKSAGDFVQTSYSKKINDGTVNIQISADKDNYSFYYSINNNDAEYMCKASTRFLCCELVGKCFTGAVIGIYAQSEEETNAQAKFRCFDIIIKEPLIN